MAVDMNLGQTRAIISDCIRAEINRAQMAYILATAFWESAQTMEPVVEAFWLTEEWRKANLRYYPWHGRGLVQITWEDNYRRASPVAGVDLAAEPDKALDPTIARKLLIDGCMTGLYTGKKITDYITDSKKDFVGARRVVNGTDKAKSIASLAHEYEHALALDGIGRGPDLTLDEMPVIRKGDQGSAVLIHQQDLYRLGYFSGDQDGKFGSLTEAATIEFQLAHDCDPDGVVGRETRTAMRDAEPRRRAQESISGLRAKGSGTIKDGDRAFAAGGVAVGASELLGGVAEDALEKAERLDDLGLLDQITGWIGSNIDTVILFAGAVLTGYFVLRMMRRRVEDHNTGAHRGR